MSKDKKAERPTTIITPVNNSLDGWKRVLVLVADAVSLLGTDAVIFVFWFVCWYYSDSLLHLTVCGVLVEQLRDRCTPINHAFTPVID